ncbi:MAG: hypothetical protein ABR991_10825 [Terracidiphilus sp.]
MAKMQREPLPIPPLMAVVILVLAINAPACRAGEAPPPPVPTPPTVSQESASEPQKPLHKWIMGNDFDLLPFAFHGYSSGGYIGRNGWRASNLMSASTAPSFMLSSGFSDRRTYAYTGMVDRFFGDQRKSFAGFWAGAGGGYWRSRIRASGSETSAKYHDFVFTAGGGYLIRLSRHFYLDPCVSGNFVVAGQRHIPVSGLTYKPPVFTPDASVKFGFNF